MPLTTPRRRRAARQIVAVAAGLCLLLFGCSTTSAEPVIVQAWFHAGQGGERAVMEEQVTAFNLRSPDVQVQLRLLPEGDYSQLVEDAVADDALPCMLDLDGPYLTSYAARGLLQPLTEDMIGADLREDVLPSLITQGTYDGQLHGLGTFDSGLGLWGNRVLLEQAGVRIPSGVDDAWTFEELNDNLRLLQDLPGVEHAIDFKMNYGVGEWFTYGLAPIVWGFGGEIHDDDAADPATALTAPDTVEALTWWQGLLEEGLAPAEQDVDDSFYAERTIALSWVGHWMWEAHQSALGEDLVLLPLPQMPEAHVTGLGSWQWGITAGCDHPVEAASFLRFLLEPEEVLRMTAANGAVPATGQALARSELYGPDGPLRIFADQLEAGLGRARPVTAEYGAVTAAFAGAVDEIRSGADVDEALGRAADAVREAGG